MDKSKIRVLAIDEHQESLTALKALILASFPEAEVSAALSGQQGLDLAAAADFDVILLPLTMSRMDGLDACTRLKADEKQREIPVIFITAAQDDQGKRIKALACGAEAFLSKPIDEVDLTAQMRVMIKISAANTLKNNEQEKLAALLREETQKTNNSTLNTKQLLEDLRREKALIEAIFDSIPGFLYVYDESGKLIKWNIKHEEMTGYSTEELSRMTLEQWYDPDEFIKIQAAVNNIFEKGYSETEAQLRKKNGENMTVRMTGAPLKWDGHQYFAGIGMDITEQKLVEEALLESQTILKIAFENSPAGLAIADAPSGKLRYVNKTGLRMLHKLEEDIEKSISINTYIDNWRIFHIDGTHFLMEELPLTRAILYGETCSAEFMIKSDSMEDSYMLANAAPIRDSNNNIIAGVLVILDITLRKKFEVQLQQNLDDLLRSQRIAHLGTWRLNPQTAELVWSDELFRMYGYDPSLPPPIFSEHLKLFNENSREKFSSALDRTKTSGTPYELELEIVTKGGLNKWVWVRGEGAMDADGLVTDLWGSAQDITERKNSENELLYLSNHDHLTDLYNRRFFEQELKRLSAKEHLPLSIIMCDVNGLKLVNDSFGHDAGDMLLKKLAETIKKASREKDVVARIGGDEFVVLLPNTSQDECIKVAGRMKELTNNKTVANIELSISCGYATKTTEQQSMIEVIANAENHMYRHKLHERTSMRSKTIDLIMNALFEKSSREAAHSNRVGNICQAIASKMNLDTDAVHQIKTAGLIHDIGKIGIDEKILNKPGKLTESEKIDIERHPEIGWRLLSSADEFSELAQFVLHHQEKWDGSGYPNGLKGEEIKLEARIIGVADAYDAMTSTRSYRPALSKQEAIKELKRCSGSQFDPHIVDVFVNHVL